jgi:hypothetical protein
MIRVSLIKAPGGIFLLRLLLLQFVFFASLICLTATQATAVTDLPAEETKQLPMAKEESVSTFVPSDSAPGRGLAINVIYPEKPRYPEGAPIAVVVPGGDAPSGLGFCMHAAQVGFLEIRFAFPGGGVKGFSSSGVKDYRGLASSVALQDILQFATGKKEDYKGRTIKDLVPIKLALNNVGLVGWSNGGNIALVTLDKFAFALQAVSWIAFYESPIGPLFYPPSLGSTEDLVLNKHYREGSAATGRCLIDFRKLAYEKKTKRNPGVNRKLGEEEIPGVVYFDDNDNKRWDESKEFAFNYCIDGSGKQIYPPEVTAALERLNVFKKEMNLDGEETGGWPFSVATTEAAEDYFQERDGSLYISSICSKYPNLLVTVFGSTLDHLQRQHDHPHIFFQYNAWLDNGVHWVRLNPEPIYLQFIANMNMRNFPNNKPNTALEPDDIDSVLEPEGILKDFTYMDACIAELADRAKTKNLNSPLLEPLVSYANGAAPLPAPAVPEAKEQTTKN